MNQRRAINYAFTNQEGVNIHGKKKQPRNANFKQDKHLNKNKTRKTYKKKGQRVRETDRQTDRQIC